MTRASRKTGNKDAFTQIAQAYDVLTDPEKREIYDALGAAGLQRLRDGDPTVKKQWRLDHPPKPMGNFDVVTEGVVNFIEWGRHLRIALGLEHAVPSTYITATDAAGKPLMSGGAASGAVTFKFELTVRCMSRMKNLLRKKDITHNCDKAKFLGMKKTYYLECAYVAHARTQQERRCTDAQMCSPHGQTS